MKGKQRVGVEKLIASILCHEKWYTFEHGDEFLISDEIILYFPFFIDFPQIKVIHTVFSAIRVLDHFYLREK